jgi:hypothetical protein
MELPDSLSASGEPTRTVNPELHVALDGTTMRLTLRGVEVEDLQASFTYTSPVADGDLSDTRWLLEDYPRLKGRSSDPIATRVEGRLRALALALREAVFESAQEAQPILQALSNGTTLSRLHVSIQEPQSNPWTPWELMTAPDSDMPLSVLAASFSRISEPASSAQPVREANTLRVLLITSRPSGEDDVPFRSVASRIVQAVAASSETSIQVDLLRPPTYSALLESLAAAAEAPYDVVHFDGHGSYEPDLLDPEQRRGFLYFEGADGIAEEINGATLGADLVQYGVTYLLLNACRSAYVGSDATERAFGTLAAEVRAQGVAGVLAMGFNLYVVTAATIVADIYSALAAARNLSEGVAHARRGLYGSEAGRAGTFDWLVPISFAASATTEDQQHLVVSNLEVKASTTTPTAAAVIDVHSADGPRSDVHPFFGYDDVLLRLDRACAANRAVELVGLAGVGKSAVAGEFARWWVATTPDAAVVIDVDAFVTFAEFELVFQERWATASEQTETRVGVVVLEGVSSVIEDEVWTTSDRAAFTGWIGQQIDAHVSLVITGRTPSGLANLETIVLQGLDDESRSELANIVGFDQPSVLSLPGLLAWSQGIPAVVLQLPSIAAGLPSWDEAVVRKALWNLRSGKVEPPQLGMALIENAGLKFFDVSRLRRAALPFLLHLFQSFIADEQWRTFSQLSTLKGLNLTGEGDPLEILAEEFGPAARSGLVARITNGYLLHPLAPIAIEPGLAGTIQVLTHGNPDIVRQVMGITWGAYIQSASLVVKMIEMLGEKGAFGSQRLQRENLTNAVEISVLGGWWGLALPLLHKLRDALLAEAREDEWRAVLNEAFVRLKESPPQNEEMGPESAELQLIRLLAAEAERDGNEELVQQLRELQMQVAYSTDVVIEPVDPEKGKGIDVGAIRRISSLIKRGDVAASQDSADCLNFYNEALRIAEESKDLLRIGEIQYAIAKAYLNVKELRDPEKYETHAREALKNANALGVIGADLSARASVSLGNALVEEQRERKPPDPKRMKEAYDALLLGTAENVSHITRGSAYNGLGNLARIENNIQVAADRYLDACKEFEAAGDIRSLRAAQRNAAIVLSILGRDEDARNLARAAGMPGYS